MKDFRKKSKKGRRFFITLESKQGAPHEHRVIDNDDVYAVDGRKQKILHLRRGEKYWFYFKRKLSGENEFDCDKANTSDDLHMVFFTADPLGGNAGQCSDSSTWQPRKLEGTPEPFSEGSYASVTFDRRHPDVVYYQDRNFVAMGGAIILS